MDYTITSKQQLRRKQMRMSSSENFTAHDIVRESLTPKLHALRYDQCGYVVPLRRIFEVQPNSFSNSDLFIRLILSSIGSHLLAT